MITAIIIDDEPLARSLLREYLEALPQVNVVAECSDGFEGVKAILQHQPQLIFLDIQMPKINGFEMLELVPQPPAVIFTTAFDEYAMRAFETHAIDYLLKPFSQERLVKAVEKFMANGARQGLKPLLETTAHHPAQHDRVVVKNGGKIKIIPVADIHYLEAADDYVKIFTKEGSFLKNKTLAFFESSLPPEQFVRTHRSCLVHVQEITKIEPYEKEGFMLILRSGAQVPVSRSGYAKLKGVLGL